jgi:hypothetical protein
MHESAQPPPLILLPLAPQLVSHLLAACDYHCCDILDKVPAVEGVSSEDLRSAIWTFRSGVNSRRQPPGNPPFWWNKFEADLDAASAGYWRPFALPVGKARAADDALVKPASHSAAGQGKETVSGIHPIKSFFSNVTAAEAEAAAAAAARNLLLHEKVPGREPPAAPAVRPSSIKSFFANVSEGEAEEATAAALATPAAGAVQRKRAAASAAPLSIKRFFGGGSGGGGGGGSDAERVIVIDD